MFLVQLECFLSFKKDSFKTQFLGARGGLQQNVFLLITCVLTNVKVMVLFGPFFGQFLVDVQKHYKNRYFSTADTTPHHLLLSQVRRT